MRKQDKKNTFVVYIAGRCIRRLKKYTDYKCGAPDLKGKKNSEKEMRVGPVCVGRNKVHALVILSI